MPRKRAVNGSGTRPYLGKDGRWKKRVVVGRDHVSGKLLYKWVYGKTAEECEKKGREVAVRVDNNTYQEPVKMLLSEWLDIWLSDYTLNVKDSTKFTYTQNVELYIKPMLGKTKLCELSPHAVQGFVGKLSKLVSSHSHRPLSEKTIRNIHGVLCKALNEAERIGYVSHNPASKCILPRRKPLDISVLESEDIQAFCSAMVGNPCEDIFFIALNTGMRLSEICGLRWAAVDFRKGELTVDCQLVTDRGKDSPKNILTTPKGNRPRSFIAAPSVISRLREVRKKQILMQEEAGELWNNKLGLCFTNEIGQPVLQRTVEKRFKSVIKKAGLDGRGFTFHSLRHTFATECLRGDIDVKTISETLGHASVAFTLDVYSAFTNDMQKEAASMIESIINARKMTV